MHECLSSSDQQYECLSSSDQQCVLSFIHVYRCRQSDTSNVEPSEPDQSSCQTVESNHGDEDDSNDDTLRKRSLLVSF